MRPCIIRYQYCRPMPLKKRNSFRLQNLVNVTLSIKVALHNNEICFPSAHNATPYHNTSTSKSVPLNETIISKTFLSSSNKTAKIALDRSPDFLRLLQPIFFFVTFREEFTRISLCLYSARSLHSLIPCLLTDQNFKINSEKGYSRNISVRLFKNLTNSFREDFLGICLCSYI